VAVDFQEILIYIGLALFTVLAICRLLIRD
jgi:hypothetical protein